MLAGHRFWGQLQRFGARVVLCVLRSISSKQRTLCNSSNRWEAVR